LRDAAGTLIELTVSSATKNRVINEEFMELLFERATSLHKLDQIVTNDGAQKQDLGELPKESKILITSLAVVWGGIGTYSGYTLIRKKK
jgi:multiple sugar transport system substrate-binding protein